MEPTSEWLTTDEAAELADRHLESISRACRKGVLPAVKRGRQWFIRRADLEAYLADPPKPGPPKGTFPGRRPQDMDEEE